MEHVHIEKTISIIHVNGQKLFKQKIHPQVQKLRQFSVNSNQIAQFITYFFLLMTELGVLLRNRSSLLAIYTLWENRHRECELGKFSDYNRFLCFDHAICSPTTSSIFLLTIHPWSENHHRECEIQLVYRFLL